MRRLPRRGQMQRRLFRLRQLQQGNLTKTSRVFTRLVFQSVKNKFFCTLPADYRGVISRWVGVIRMA